MGIWESFQLRARLSYLLSHSAPLVCLSFGPFWSSWLQGEVLRRASQGPECQSTGDLFSAAHSPLIPRRSVLHPASVWCHTPPLGSAGPIQKALVQSAEGAPPCSRIRRPITETEPTGLVTGGRPEQLLSSVSAWGPEKASLQARPPVGTRRRHGQLMACRDAFRTTPPLPPTVVCDRHGFIFPFFPYWIKVRSLKTSQRRVEGGNTDGNLWERGGDSKPLAGQGPDVGLVLKPHGLCLFGRDGELPDQLGYLCLGWRHVPRGAVGLHGLDVEGWNLPGPRQPAPLFPGQQCQPPSPGTPLWTGDFKVEKEPSEWILSKHRNSALADLSGSSVLAGQDCTAEGSAEWTGILQANWQPRAEC